MATSSDQTANRNMSPKNEGDELMSELRKYLMLMAILAATVTYVGALSPPGGVWLKTEHSHLTGDQILKVTHHTRHNAFFYSNVIAFMASVVVILLLLLERSVEQVWWLFSLRTVLVLDLLALMVAYAAGASRGTFATVYASGLMSTVSIYAGVHIVKYFQAGGPGHAGGDQHTKGKNDPMKQVRKILMVFSVFASTVTYTAGLNPPGGFWPDTQDGHRAGDPVLQDFHHRLRFLAFFVCNSTAFAASLVAVMLLTTMKNGPKEGCFGKGCRHFLVAYCSVLVALLGLLLAYAFGSSRKRSSTIHVLCVQLPIVAGCIVLQFVFQKFCWEKLAGCFRDKKKKLAQCLRDKKKKLAWCRKDNLSCCCSRGANNASPNAENTNEELELKEKKLKEAHAMVLLLGTLAATITYQAGMNPPGGVWPDDRDGHKGGDPILLTTHTRRYKVFFYCNSVALVASVVVVAMLLSRHLRTGSAHKYHALEAVMILDLLSLVAAYAVGCCRDVGTSLRVIALAAGILVYILIHMVFFTLEHQYSEKEEGKMKKKRKLLLLIAILAATITYQAGLTPLGAFWLEDGGAPTHAAGYAVLANNYPRRYAAFFYCNATSFVSSIAVILLLINPNLYKFGIKCYVLHVCSVAGLLGLAGAYAAGSSRHMRTSVVVIVVSIPVSVFVMLMALISALWYVKKNRHEDGNNSSPRNGTNTVQSHDTSTPTPEERTSEEVPGSAPKNGTSTVQSHDTSTPTPEERTGEELPGSAPRNGTSIVQSHDTSTPTPKERTGEEVPGSATRNGTSTVGSHNIPTPEEITAVTNGPNTASMNEEDEKKRKKTLMAMDMYTTRKYIMLVAILVAGVTYQAGLTPPGGVWPDSIDGHAAGNPVLHDSNKRRYHLFFHSNSVSFVTSLLVILLLLLDQPVFGRKKQELPITNAPGEEKKDGPLGMGSEELLRVAQSSLCLALLGLLFAYAAGCSREWETSGYVFALVGGVVLYIAIHVLLSCSDKSAAPTDGETTTPVQASVPTNITIANGHGKDAPKTAAE